MTSLTLHHISITVTNLERSVAFYCNTIGLKRTERPAFRSPGAWLECGTQQIHLNEKANAPFPEGRRFNPTEIHFALRTDGLDIFLEKLRSLGYSEAVDEADPMRLYIDKNGPAGFPQLFLFDPDLNLVEINAPSLTVASR
jgi:glyoxylase I family protein